MQPAAIFCLEIDAAWNRLVGSRVKHLPPKADSFLLTWFALPPELIESFELRFDVFPFIKRQPTTDPNRLAGRTIREFWVGVQTWALLIRPSTMNGLPGGDNPTLAIP